MQLPVEVLANPECPHCRQAVDHVARLAQEAGVPVAGVDLVHHPEVAGSWEHSPIVRYGRAEFAGIPTPEQFQRLLAEGGGSVP